MRYILKFLLIVTLSILGYAYSLSGVSAQTKVSTQNILAISWQNAFCETHRNKRECRSVKHDAFSATHFTLHGLWPQPRDKTYCEKTKKIYLEKPLYKELLHVMPAAKSGLHQHEWKKHGTCYGTSPERYFKDSISLLNQINSSGVRDFFLRHIGQSVTLKQVRFAFDKAFGQGSGKKVKMTCYKGLINELQINLQGNISEYKKISKVMKNAKNAKNTCQKGQIDRVGFR